MSADTSNSNSKDQSPPSSPELIEYPEPKAVPFTFQHTHYSTEQNIVGAIALLKRKAEMEGITSASIQRQITSGRTSPPPTRESNLVGQAEPDFVTIESPLQNPEQEHRLSGLQLCPFAKQCEEVLDHLLNDRIFDMESIEIDAYPCTYLKLCKRIFETEAEEVEHNNRVHALLRFAINRQPRLIRFALSPLALYNQRLLSMEAPPFIDSDPIRYGERLPAQVAKELFTNFAIQAHRADETHSVSKYSSPNVLPQRSQ